METEYRTIKPAIYTDALNITHRLRKEIQHEKQERKKVERENKKLRRAIESYRNGNMRSMCNISEKDKKALRIAIRREYPLFEANVKGFVEMCIANETKKSYREFLDGVGYEVYNG